MAIHQQWNGIDRPLLLEIIRVVIYPSRATYASFLVANGISIPFPTHRYNLNISIVHHSNWGSFIRSFVQDGMEILREGNKFDMGNVIPWWVQLSYTYVSDTGRWVFLRSLYCWVTKSMLIIGNGKWRLDWPPYHNQWQTDISKQECLMWVFQIVFKCGINFPIGHNRN